MAEDTTQFITRRPESTIFNTSIRGWIALILAIALAVSMICLMVAFCFEVKIPTEVSATMMTLFTGSVTGALTHYFQQHSREGQK